MHTKDFQSCDVGGNRWKTSNHFKFTKKRVSTLPLGNGPLFFGIKAVETVLDNADCSVGLISLVDEHLLSYDVLGIKWILYYVDDFVAGASYVFQDNKTKLKVSISEI